MRIYSILELLNDKGMLTCPICQKEFKPSDDTNYIVDGGYTCSWKCFLKEVRRLRKEKEDNSKRNKKGDKK